jgi:hypothetical protein
MSEVLYLLEILVCELIFELMMASDMIIEFSIYRSPLHKYVLVFLLGNSTQQFFLVYYAVGVFKLLIDILNFAVSDDQICQVKLLEHFSEFIFIEGNILLIVYAHCLLQSHETISQNEMHLHIEDAWFLLSNLIVFQFECIEIHIRFRCEVDEVLNSCRYCIQYFIVSKRQHESNFIIVDIESKLSHKFADSIFVHSSLSISILLINILQSMLIGKVLHKCSLNLPKFVHINVSTLKVLFYIFHFTVECLTQWLN